MNRDLLISPDLTILEAMDAVTKGNLRIAFVVDAEDVLIGALTDGDLRRFILAGNDLSGSIRDAFNRDPVFVRRGAYSMQGLQAIFQERSVDVIPVVDDEHRIVDHVSWHDAFEDSETNTGDIKGVPIVIMAGGMGTRLQPFTHVLPKPLLPIDGKPVIDHIFDHFRSAGATAFYLTVNHKARILRAYLEDADTYGAVTFIQEDTPLGTAGALRLLVGYFDQPVIVTNCDILVAVNYRELLGFHAASGCEMTLVAAVRNFRLPYGSCAIGADGNLQSIEEKPELTKLVNTGLYVMNPRLFNDIPAGHPYDMTALIADLMHSGHRVAVFPVSSEAWIDVGEWEEYRRATRHMGRGVAGYADPP